MIHKFLVGLLFVLVLASPASAASYYSGFVEHWKTTLGHQSTIAMGVVLAGAVGIFVITRGKRLK